MLPWHTVNGYEQNLPNHAGSGKAHMHQYRQTDGILKSRVCNQGAEIT
jgi:hypothetical protein